MYCIHCGTNIPDNSKFCQNCGNPIEKEPERINNDELKSEIIAGRTAEENPYYETVVTEAEPQHAVHAQSVQNTYPSAAKPNPFAFISAGIMGIMLLLYFLPWFYIDDKAVNLLSYFVSRSPLEYSYSTAMVLFLIFMFIAIGLMIPGIIMAIIRKNHIPMVFAITSSVSINLSMFFFAFTEEAWTVGVSIVPIIIYLLSFINIAFAIPAKRR